MLNLVEENILENLYDRFLVYAELINSDDYNFSEPVGRDRVQECASYLKNLKEVGYVDFPENIFSTGGRINQKYRNNVVMIFTEEIRITEKGKLYIAEKRQTVARKIKNNVQNIMKKTVEIISNRIAGFLASVIMIVVIGFIFFIF